MSSINAPPPRYSDVSHSSVYSNNSDLDPNEKIKLYDNQAERRKVSELEDFYAIIVATEHLESAFINDFVIGVLSRIIRSASNSSRATMASFSFKKGSLKI